MLNRKYVIRIGFLLSVIFLLWTAAIAAADSDTNLSRGETVYVSIYSNVFVGTAKEKFLLSSLLSVRNTDPKHAIALIKADYYDTDGRNIKRYICRALC